MEVNKPLRCFLSTPFSGMFKEVRQVIVAALQRVGVEPLLSENLGIKARSIAEVIQEQIQSADFVIADVTNGNANVLYEVGFAHALKKPVLFILQELDTAPPSIIHSYLFFIYDPNHLSRLESTIASWVTRLVRQSEKTEL